MNELNDIIRVDGRTYVYYSMNDNLSVGFLESSADEIHYIVADGKVYILFTK